MSKSRIIIVGGGFAGVKCAKTLRQKLSEREAEIILFDRNNHMVFSPLLAEVAGASINPDAVAAPLRQMLPNVRCRMEEVQGLHLEENRITFLSMDEGVQSLDYDHLVLAAGSDVMMGLIPGMADHAFPLKTIGDGMLLRSHLLQQLEIADVTPSPERRRWHLSFVIVGGGFSGIEVAGEINDLVHGACRRFHNIRSTDIRVRVVHSRDFILPEVPERLRTRARALMEEAGISFVFNARASLITAEGVRTEDGRFIDGATVVATVGNTISPLIQALNVSKTPRGLLPTEADLRVKGTSNVWAIGDCSENLNAWNNKPAPWTGQFAEREGRQAAENLVRCLRREPTRPFYYKPLGQLCSIGGHKAVAEILGMHLSGFWAWFLWRGIYLFKMPSLSRRLKIGFDWAWDLLFARDLVYVRPDITERVSSASFAASDVIFQEGDPATEFYVIEQGEVDILRGRAGETQTVQATLKRGEFFGEMALMENRPHQATARARTPVRLMVLSAKLFTRMSKTWTSVNELLTRHATTRKGLASPLEKAPHK